MGLPYIRQDAFRKAGSGLFCLAIPVFAVNDLRAQEQIVHSNLHDFSVLNRVVSRVEALDEFDPERTYNII